MEGEDVGLMALTGFAAGQTFVCKDRTVEPVGGFAGFDFVGEVSNALQHASGFINVVAQRFELR